MRVDGQIDAHVPGFLSGDHRLAIGSSAICLHRLTDQPHVQIETNAGDVSGLLGTQHVAGPANLQVFQRNRHTRAQLVVLSDGGKPVVGGLGERSLAWVEEIGVATFPAPTHPAAQLVQLGQAECLGPLNDEGVGVGDVQAGLDDRGAHQDVVVAVPEPLDGLLKLFLRHLSVGDGDPGLGHQCPHPRGGGIDGVDPVVHIERLAVAQQFAAQCRGDLFVIIGSDIGQHRVPLLGRGQDRRHLPDSGQAHLQGPGNRGGTHGQHIDVGPQAFDVFLVFDAEALLLIDHHQSEILPPHPGLQQSVRADDDVDAAVGHSGDYRTGLTRIGEP